MVAETNEAEPANGASEDFMAVLENGVRAVLKSKKATSSERVAAVTAGAKLLMIKHRISGDAEKGFFDS